MKKLTLLVTSLLSLTTAPRLAAQCFQFTQEHVDLLAFVWDAPSNRLSLMASNHTDTLYASNQCVVICPATMKWKLPAGTPLGNEDDPLWILPQNQYAGVPYVGVSANLLGYPGEIFNDPLAIQLIRVEGPGHFIVWQNSGTYDIKMDTRDGIGPGDKLEPTVGGHEHHNWGFTTSGVYRVYFQAVGVRVGDSTNTYSPETPFTFHIQPLKSFETWQATNWPCECRSNIIAAAADPDSDRGVNAIEYALGTNPKTVTTNRWPTVSLVTTNGHQYGALTYTRAKSAEDCIYEVVVANSVTATNWQPLTASHHIEDVGMMERVTMRDTVPLGAGQPRFYRLQVKLQ